MFLPFDAECCRPRNLIERTFCRLEDFRAIATRYDETARSRSDKCVEVRNGRRKSALRAMCFCRQAESKEDSIAQGFATSASKWEYIFKGVAYAPGDSLAHQRASPVEPRLHSCLGDPDDLCDL
jgi:hypothetical protein